MTTIEHVEVFENIEVPVKCLHADAVVPARNHPSDAGFDLYAVEDAVIAPGETVIVKTGIAMALPVGFELQVRPRSGNSVKTKIRVANSPGTVDANYRGEIGVIIDNITNPIYTMSTYIMDVMDGKSNVADVWAAAYEKAIEEGTYTVRKGDRIAQGVIAHVPSSTLFETATLDETDRGTDGFGSSGK